MENWKCMFFKLFCDCFSLFNVYKFVLNFLLIDLVVMVLRIDICYCCLCFLCNLVVLCCRFVENGKVEMICIVVVFFCWLFSSVFGDVKIVGCIRR